MKRALVVIALLVQVACGETTAPSQLNSSYFLSSVDGHPLPVSHGSDGSMLIGSLLDFGPATRSRDETEARGTVRYLLDIQHPDQSVSQSEVKLDYVVRDGILRINLCPPLALCLTSMELAGPTDDGSGELLLTYYLAGNPGSVFRYFRIRPD